MEQTNSNFNIEISNLDNPNTQVNEKKNKRDKRNAIIIIIITASLVAIFCAIYFIMYANAVADSCICRVDIAQLFWF